MGINHKFIEFIKIYIWKHITHHFKPCTDKWIDKVKDRDNDKDKDNQMIEIRNLDKSDQYIRKTLTNRGYKNKKPLSSYLRPQHHKIIWIKAYFRPYYSN